MMLKFEQNARMMRCGADLKWNGLSIGFALMVSSVLIGCGTSTITPGRVARPVEQTVPSVLITGRTAQAVLDSIVAYRKKRGARLLRQHDDHVDFSMPIPKASVPTEAHLRYQISLENEKLRLSARVFQVQYPGTDKAHIKEITAAVFPQLTAELTQYRSVDVKP